MDLGARLCADPGGRHSPCRRLPQDAATFGALNGLLVGILLHIATTILFETADGHEFNARKFLTVLLGLGLSLFTTHL